jgi:integrase
MPATVNRKVQTDKSNGKQFITLKVEDNGKPRYVKVGLWTRDERQAQRWADCLEGVEAPEDARSIIDYLRKSPSPAIERQRIAELTASAPLVDSFTLEDAQRELADILGDFELDAPSLEDVREWRSAAGFNQQRDILERLGIPADWLANNPELFQSFKPRRKKLNPNIKPQWQAVQALGLPAHKPARGPKLSACLAEWETEQELKGTKPQHRATYRNRFNDFIKATGDKPAKALTKSDFVKFRDAKLKELAGKSNTTKNAHLKPVAKIFKTARKRMQDGALPAGLSDWLEVFETLPYKPKASNREPVPPELFKAWLAKAEELAGIDWQAYGDAMPVDKKKPPHIQALCVFNNRKQAKRTKRNALLAHIGFCLAANCGTTGIDLNRLKWSELKLTGKLPLFMQSRTKTETGEDMIIPVKCPLLPATVKSLKRWKEYQDNERPSEYVFTSELCTPFDQNDSSKTSEIFGRIRKEVKGTNGWQARHCRNIGATVQRDNELPEAMATAWLRHSEGGTNPFYRGQAKDDYLKRLVQAIGKVYFG